MMPSSSKPMAVLFYLALILIPASVESFTSTTPFDYSRAETISPFSRIRPALDIAKSRSQLKNLGWKKPTDEQVENWLSKYGEASRYYRRDVFTPGDWVRSRRRTRIFENLRSTFKSGLIRQISMEVSVLVAMSLFVIFYNRYMPMRFSFLPVLKIPLVPFNLAASSLGLMLSFRTNVCYQRWNEARTNWGKIINDSRSLARMGCIWGRSYKNADPSLLQRFGEAICSFSRSVMNRTLPSQEDEKAFQLYCYHQVAKTNPTYANLLANAKHRPTAALAEITSIMVEMQLHPLHQVEVEARISELCNSMGACERILTSPVPTFYPRHTTRFLAVWLLFLPMALHDILTGWNHFLLVPVMVLLSGFLLGIEELSNQMEEPFSILPQEKMCEGSIRGPVMEQVQRSLSWKQSTYYGYGGAAQTAAAVKTTLESETAASSEDTKDKKYEVSYTTKGGVPLPAATNGSSSVNGKNGRNAMNRMQSPPPPPPPPPSVPAVTAQAIRSDANGQHHMMVNGDDVSIPPPPSSGASPDDAGFFDI